jgi:predicted DCC family thiol-disulfide oxidoreductase YuxK
MALTIFHDDSCVICRTEMARFYSIYSADMDLIALSHGTDELEQHGIKLEDALTLMHVIDEQGKLHIGMDAIRLMYRRLGKPKTAWFTSLPVLRGFFDWLYPIFARHRYKMPVWLLGIGVKDVCQDGYCQMPAQQKAAQIRKQDHESH